METITNMENKIVNWIEINSPNASEAFDFYSAVFGWTKSEVDFGDMGVYTMLHEAGNETPFAGIMELKGPEWEGIPPHWMNYFHTDDIEATCEKIKQSGGKITNDPFEIPGTGIVAMCVDAHGAAFSLLQPATK